MTTALLTHTDCLEHVTPDGHPERVDRLRAALAAGGVDNGAPGVRAHYHDHYYAAYVLDPDGVNVEVVCQAVPG